MTIAPVCLAAAMRAGASAGRALAAAILLAGATATVGPAGAQSDRPSLRDLDMDAVPRLDVPGLLRVQLLLKGRGFDPIRIDGVMGPLTQSAVSNFQERYGIRTRGEIDNQTLFALGAVDLAGPAR